MLRVTSENTVSFIHMSYYLYEEKQLYNWIERIIAREGNRVNFIWIIANL